MDYLKIALSSVISLVVLFILAKLIGNRQLSQITMFDYVNGITIGSIAAEMATSLDKHWTEPLLAMLIYGIATAVISYICCKFLPIRRFVNGKTIILYKNSKFYYNGLKRARLDVNEFLEQCRNNGYFDISEIDTVIMEQNGKLSILPKSSNRTVTVSDMALTVPDSVLSVNIVLDGKILEQNLTALGLNKKWLLKGINKSGQSDLSKILLATADKGGNLKVYIKDETKYNNDIFM